MGSGGIFILVIAAVLVVGIIVSNKSKKDENKNEDKK